MAGVLLTCGGKWVGMVEHVRAALAAIGPPGARVVVGDLLAATPAGHFADGSVVLPGFGDDGYVDAVAAAAAAHDLDLVLPIIDLDMLRLAAAAGPLAAAGITVVGPPVELVELCSDKQAFAELAAAEGIGVPMPVARADLAAATYPLFYKRRIGFGSIGAGRADDAAAAERALLADDDLVFEEHLTGDEFSVDAFLAAGGRPLIAVQRLRERVVGGESWRSRTVRLPALTAAAGTVFEALGRRGYVGAVNVQLIGADEPRVIDVNPRLGSASTFSDFAVGGRLFEYVLRQAWGDPPDEPVDYREGLALYRFLGDVYHADGEVLGAVPAPPDR